MKAAEDGRRYNVAHVLDGAMDRSVLVERLMSPELIIIGGILLGFYKAERPPAFRRREVQRRFRDGATLFSGGSFDPHTPRMAASEK
jgi:hypothetical protein